MTIYKKREREREEDRERERERDAKLRSCNIAMQTGSSRFKMLRIFKYSMCPAQDFTKLRRWAFFKLHNFWLIGRKIW